MWVGLPRPRCDVCVLRWRTIHILPHLHQAVLGRGVYVHTFHAGVVVCSCCCWGFVAHGSRICVCLCVLLANVLSTSWDLCAGVSVIPPVLLYREQRLPSRGECQYPSLSSFLARSHDLRTLPGTTQLSLRIFCCGVMRRGVCATRATPPRVCVAAPARPSQDPCVTYRYAGALYRCVRTLQPAFGAHYTHQCRLEWWVDCLIAWCRPGPTGIGASDSIRGQDIVDAVPGSSQQ